MQASLASLTFGAEFEVVLPAHYTRESAAADLARRIGKTVDHHYRPSGQNWKVVNDGSIRAMEGPGTTLEFVSPYVPPMQGDAGIAEIIKVCDALTAMGAKCNISTGMHVHVGTGFSNQRTLTPAQLGFFKNVVKLYGRYEAAIDTLMPHSRRANAAYFCRSINLVPANNVDRAASVRELSHGIWHASHADQPRYHKVNLEAFEKHGTVEFRQHSGTVDAEKAVNWIKTCLQIVAAAKAGKTGVGQATSIAWDVARLVGKQKNCASLIARPEGATNAEIRQAFGYRTISARTNLKRAGLAFEERRDRLTGKTRFFAVQNGATVATEEFPATLEGFCDLIEADTEQRAYFAERTRLLARPARR